MPAVPSSLFEPLWGQFSALLPERPEFDPSHPLGCHRRRVPDRMVLKLVVEALVQGSGYERVATTDCSDWTIRNRLKQWSNLGLAHELHRIALTAYDKMIGLELSELSVDGCHTKAPCKGNKAGPSPVTGPGKGSSGPPWSTAPGYRSVWPQPAPTGTTPSCSNRPSTQQGAKSGTCPPKPPCISIPPTTASPAAGSSTTTTSSARSPARACPFRSRSACAGWLNAPSRG